ncbi:rod shape-determining protein RodA [Alphaproteobacteria bacterium]|nr:rod shape-determining protein RodA [Alphaproteobacteria bacterium]
MYYKNYKFNKNRILDSLININWLIISILLILFIVGCTVIYSASGGSFYPLVEKHIYKFIFSLIILFFICCINYEFFKSCSYYFYLLSIFLLLFLVFFGTENSGSQRWINLGFFSLQPSEFAKITLILAISKYYSDVTHLGDNSLIKVIIPVLLIAIPFIIIVNQPDLGTSILLLANGISLIIIAGISLWFILLGLFLFLISIPIIWSILFDYQKQRILTFLNPEGDPLGSGYHIAQSKIAIGSGGFTGKGFMQGSQSQLEFIPEIHTDFVFSVFSEEFGYLGALVIVFLYLYLFIYGLLSCYKALHTYDKLVIFGLTINFFLYFLINISMVIGLVPVVGVPLPIISYGGSSMLAIMISFGIIERININRRLH